MGCSPGQGELVGCSLAVCHAVSLLGAHFGVVSLVWVLTIGVFCGEFVGCSLLV